MKNKTKVILIAIILVVLLLAWAPWITNEYALNKVKANSNFMSQHSPGIDNSEIWYVSFFGFVI